MRDGHKQVAVALGQTLIRTAIDAINEPGTMKVTNKLRYSICGKCSVTDGNQPSPGTPVHSQEVRQGPVGQKRTLLDQDFDP